MDETGWFSVTPEVIANHIAERFKIVGVNTVVDGFAGVGGNAIAFALQGLKVIAVELDPIRLACAKHNAMVCSLSIYSRANQVDLRCPGQDYLFSR